jgi:branched-chain amino acid transport system ATP-binding protein
VSVAPAVERDGPAGSAASVLAVDGVTCRFGGVIAVNAVSFAVSRGELFGLIGPNGAGKTTLFNVITGLTAPSAGAVRHRGEDITGLPPYRVAERGIARTFQNVRLFGELAALDNVMIARHVRTRSGLVGGVLGLGPARQEERATRERARALLALVGLADRPEEHARNFSYGDQRRLEIARALALEPELLLLDEPAAGMNPNETHEVTELIGRLRDELGLAILVIEHDMHVVEGISDRVVALDHGVKIAEGNYESVATHPAVIEAYLGRDPEALAEE